MGGGGVSMVDYDYLDRNQDRLTRRRDEEASSYSDYQREQGELNSLLADTRGGANRMEIVGRMFENIHDQMKGER
jgi:hypothetical protein